MSETCREQRKESDMTQDQREQWDAVVVGSGLGGLACAAYLNATGRRTLVLEAHDVAGGDSQTFRRGVRGRTALGAIG